MKPLTRVVPRLFVEPIVSPAVSRSLRLSNRPSVRAATCLQCRIRSQIRRYTDDSKPSLSSLSAKSSEPPKTSPLPPLPEDVVDELPSTRQDRQTAIGKRFSSVMDQLQGNIFIASQRLNDLTGYSGIEALKDRIAALESRVQNAHETVRNERSAYKTTVADRASTQREVTTLLARKDTWTPTDLERFTSLYRMDHTNEQAVQEAAMRLGDAEREAEHAASELSKSILSRYHEEQIWSDKIRRMSTWGTWGLMGVNILLFLVFQLGLEPWRRQRLVRGFEDKVKEALDKGNGSHVVIDGETADSAPKNNIVQSGPHELGNETGSMTSDSTIYTAIPLDEGQRTVDTALGVTTTQPGSLLLTKPETWKAIVEDLFSHRVISKRMQDITFIALESAATGAAIATVVATLILRNS